LRPKDDATILIGVMLHKLVPTLPLWTLGPASVALFCAVATAGTVAGGEVVPVNAAERMHLARTARRTVEDAVARRPTYQPGFVPEGLRDKQAEAIVRLRHSGYLLASASAGPAPLTTAVRDAALTAAEMWLERYQRPEDILPQLLVEIEVVGPPEPVTAEVDWTRPRAIDPYFEPGVDGIVLNGPKVHKRFSPTELFTSDMTLADALETIAKKTRMLAADVTKTRLARFRTVHWYQAAPHAPIVSLHRGMTLVAPDEVSRAGMDRAIEKLADYMIYRQKPDGLFTYQYEPAWNRYTEDDSLVRQVGAVMAMSAYARESGSAAAKAAADLGIRYHLRGLRDVPGKPDAAYIATADGRNKLGVTALLCLALAEHPDADRYADTRKRLVRGMLTLQRPSGMFATAFPPAREFTAQDYFPGEALLAMASQQRHEPSADILDAFDRAIEFYRGYFREKSSPAFVPWQVQAYAIVARASKRSEYAHYVFELTDWLAEKQLTRDNCEWPELRGGIASYQPGRAGVSTASYLEGFTDALALARDLGDTERARRYERVVRDATRFVMQLQFRSEEAYFVRSLRDTVGGIRTAPALNLLRIDHCQHALTALCKARRVLFADER